MLVLSAPVNCHIMLEEINTNWTVTLPKLLEKINICTLHTGPKLKAEDLACTCKLINERRVIFNIHLNNRIANIARVLPNLQKYQYLNHFIVDILNIPEMISELSDSGFTVIASLYPEEEIQEDLIEQILNDGAQAIFVERSPNSDPQLLRKIISQVQEYQDLGYNIELSSCFPNCISRQNTQNCFAATVSCALNSLGQLSPCRYSGVWSTLNLVDHNLEEVWQDLVFKPWREYKNTKCESCPQSGLCYGGCKLYEDDPLIYPRNMAEDQIVRDVVLEEGLRPLPLYKVRQEPFGILLMREDRVIPVSEKAAIVLKLFDGEHTLKDIKDKLGFGVIPFIYSLHMRGFVKLQEK